MAPRRRPRWMYAVLGAVVLALLAFLVFHKGPAKKPPPPAVPVAVARAQAQDIAISITTLGAAQAWRSDTIFSQVSGKLLSVAFTEGANVRAGQLLAVVDPAPYRAALMQAQGVSRRDRALLAGARVDLARYQTLAAQDSISRQTLDDEAALVRQDEGAVQADEGAVATAEVNLRWCRITSPIAGRAGVRMVDPGNIVSAGGTPGAASGTAGGAASGGAGAGSASAIGIVVINQIEPIAVTFTVPQGEFQRLSDLSNGFRKPLAVEALSQETGDLLGSGELTIADNRVDQSTGTVELKARFDNAGERLWPGQFVNVRLTLQTLPHATTIPAAAVTEGPNGPFVYVVGAGAKVTMRPVSLAWTQGATAVVQTGIKPGETVVTDGQMTLKPGSQVRVPGAAPRRRAKS